MNRSRKESAIHAPRWPVGRAVPVVRDLEIGDDRAYADLDVAQGRFANATARDSGSSGCGCATPI